jgi:hypothetical protein
MPSARTEAGCDGLTRSEAAGNGHTFTQGVDTRRNPVAINGKFEQASANITTTEA